MNIHIFGAGRMGAGIAQACAVGGHDVHLHDQSPALVDDAIKRVEASIERAVSNGKMEPMDLSLTRGGDLQGAELVIEAIYENLTAKKALFSWLASQTDAVLATNTSSFQVEDFQVHDRVLGLHFFFPAHINSLVELVPAGASRDAISLARKAMISIGKTVIETTDAPGFAINRFLVPVLNEAALMLDEGLDMGAIEASGKAAFGMPLGPFALMNASGNRVCLHAQKTLSTRLPSIGLPAKSLQEKGAENGVWDPPSGTPDPALEARFVSLFQELVNELLEEGVASKEDVEKGAQVGLGWTKFPL